MAAPPAKTPPKTLQATGPALILVIVIIAAIIGYYQIIYYPAAVPSSTTFAVVPADLLNVTVTILPGSGSQSSNASAIYFDPPIITVYIGYNATVIWKNKDTTVHTVTSQSLTPPDPRFLIFGPQSPASSWNNIQASASVNFTFDVVGNYSYFCSYHSWMKGTVNVKPASSSLTVSSSSTSHTSTTSLVGGAYLLLLIIATVLASNRATLMGSGKDPWRVKRSISRLVSISPIPAVLT